jgi:hypothetical protein
MWINWKRTTSYLISCNAWKCEDEVSTISRGSPCIEFTIVKSSIFESDGETEPCSTTCTCARRICTPEAIEYSSEGGFLHTFTVIANAYSNFGQCFDAFNLNRFSIRVIEGVGD